MRCKICASESRQYLAVEVLGKYKVSYYRCSVCQFIQTEDPYWLAEAYSSAITRLDIGLIMRNESMIPVVKAVINTWFDSDAKFVDYGGGYGMLVRMMRDRGYDYYRQDIYCANLYAETFDITDVTPFKAELLTAFEVFEHLVNPVEELEKMLGLSDTILFSTAVQPSEHVTPENWWYFIPETGQHIALHSRTSLETLAKKFNLFYCWNEQDVHLFSRKKIPDSLFKLITHPRWGNWYNKVIRARPSLSPNDFAAIRSSLQDSLSMNSSKQE